MRIKMCCSEMSRSIRDFMVHINFDDYGNKVRLNISLENKDAEWKKVDFCPHCGEEIKISLGKS